MDYQVKMFPLHCLLLMFALGRCKDDQRPEIKTAHVGDDVTLSCPREMNDLNSIFFWMRLSSGQVPEYFGATAVYEDDSVSTHGRITVKSAPFSFVLLINETTQNDEGVYLCFKVDHKTLTFLKVIYLRVQGSQPDKVAVIQVPPSDQVRSLTLQCSVLSDSVSNTCSGGPSVCWFTAGSSESSLGVLYTPGYTDGECESPSEGRAAQECVQNPSTEINSSHEGSYSCVVAACGRIMFGDFTFQSQVLNPFHLLNTNKVLNTSLAALALSLVISACLLCIKKDKPCGCCSATSEQSQQRLEDTCLYSAAIFTVMTPGGGDKMKAAAEERRRIYAAVRTFRLN